MAAVFKGRRASVLRVSEAAFTLLEIMLAAAILIVLTVTVSQFTSVTVRSADFSSQDSEETLACNGLRHLLAAQLASLPVSQSGSLAGMNINGHGGRRDAMQMVCPSGNGLLTPDAKGYYQITLNLREFPRGSGKMTLGLEREPWVDDDDDDDDDDSPAGLSAKNGAKKQVTVQKLPSDWIPLLPGVQALEIAYFDARLNAWVDRWTDQAILPNLVRLRLTMREGQPPYEIVERVPNGGLQRTTIIQDFSQAGRTGTTPAPTPGAQP